MSDVLGLVAGLIGIPVMWKVQAVLFRRMIKSFREIGRPYE